jgi:hypothetical protein
MKRHFSMILSLVVGSAVPAWWFQQAEAGKAKESAKPRAKARAKARV